MLHANLDAPCLSIAEEWDQLAAEYIHKACCAANIPLLRKRKFKLNTWAANSSTHTN
jgi:hypothetical protein